MANCETCGIESGQYKFCSKCNTEYRKAQAAKPAPASDADTVDQLQKMNNNLYAIRTLLDELVFFHTGKRIKWDSENKRFEMVPYARQ